MVIEEYHKRNAELEKIYNYISKGIILRSKTDQYELGEKSIKYFLTPEKKNQAKSHVRKIYNENNEESADPDDILADWKNFIQISIKEEALNQKLIVSTT